MKYIYTFTTAENADIAKIQIGFLKYFTMKDSFILFLTILDARLKYDRRKIRMKPLNKIFCF